MVFFGLVISDIWHHHREMLIFCKAKRVVSVCYFVWRQVRGRLVFWSFSVFSFAGFIFYPSFLLQSPLSGNAHLLWAHVRFPDSAFARLFEPRGSCPCRHKFRHRPPLGSQALRSRLASGFAFAKRSARHTRAKQLFSALRCRRK